MWFKVWPTTMTLNLWIVVIWSLHTMRTAIACINLHTSWFFFTQVLLIGFLAAVVAFIWPSHGEPWLTIVWTAQRSIGPCTILSLGMDVFTFIADVIFYFRGAFVVVLVDLSLLLHCLSCFSSTVIWSIWYPAPSVLPHSSSIYTRDCCI